MNDEWLKRKLMGYMIKPPNENFDSCLPCWLSTSMTYDHAILRCELLKIKVARRNRPICNLIDFQTKLLELI